MALKFPSWFSCDVTMAGHLGFFHHWETTDIYIGAQAYVHHSLLVERNKLYLPVLKWIIMQWSLPEKTKIIKFPTTGDARQRGIMHRYARGDVEASIWPVLWKSNISK